MRLRVVCGLEVTIATFWPTKRFNSVDFPAFGLPTMATNPERCFSLPPLFSSNPALFSAVSAGPAVSTKRLLLGILLLYHWQLQGALMIRIMDQRDVRRLRILRRFEGHNSAAVVVLLSGGRIQAMHEEAQTAALRDAPREKCEVVEYVFLGLARRHKFFLAQRFAISC